MALKFVLETLDDLDDGIKSLYSKHTDGKFYLDVDGAVAKGKVDEFRDNNISLKQQLEEMTDKYGKIDIDKYNDLMDKAALDDGKKRLTMESVDEVVAERTAAMKTDHEAQIRERDDRITSQGGQLNSLLIDSAIRDAAVTAGVRKGALEDVVLRAQRTFKVVEGKALAHDTDGKVVYGKDGTNPLTANEWVGGLKTTAEHLFESSKGGGAGGGGKPPPTGVQDITQLSPLQKISQGMAAKE